MEFVQLLEILAVAEVVQMGNEVELVKILGCWS